MKKNTVLGLMIITLILIVSQTSFVASQYSDQNVSAMQIVLVKPIDNSTNNNVTKLIFTFDTAGTCEIYTNYSGSWSQEGDDIWMLDESGSAKLLDVEYFNAGEYIWNVKCVNSSGGDTTWAQEENSIFRIIPPAQNPIENNTNTTIPDDNQTINNTQDPPENNNTINNSNTNQTINNTQDPPENNNTINNSNTNQSDNTTQTPSIGCPECEYENICYETGAKIIIEDKQHTCNSLGEFIRPMENGENCSANDDCKSNYCLNEFCRIDNIFTTILATFGFY